MAWELTVVMRFERQSEMPDKHDLEHDLDCVVIEYEEEEV